MNPPLYPPSCALGPALHPTHHPAGGCLLTAPRLHLRVTQKSQPRRKYVASMYEKHWAPPHGAERTTSGAASLSEVREDAALRVPRASLLSFPVAGPGAPILPGSAAEPEV